MGNCNNKKRARTKKACNTAKPVYPKPKNSVYTPKTKKTTPFFIQKDMAPQCTPKKTINTLQLGNELEVLPPCSYQFLKRQLLYPFHKDIL